MKKSITKLYSGIRDGLLWLLVLLNSQASAHQNTFELEPIDRLESLRKKLLENDRKINNESRQSTRPEAEFDPVAQWLNWPNWPNWGNWGNWGNWRNW